MNHHLFQHPNCKNRRVEKNAGCMMVVDGEMGYKTFYVSYHISQDDDDISLPLDMNFDLISFV